MFRIHYKIGDVTGFFHMYRSTNLRYTSQYSTEKMILMNYMQPFYIDEDILHLVKPFYKDKLSHFTFS